VRVEIYATDRMVDRSDTATVKIMLWTTTRSSGMGLRTLLERREGFDIVRRAGQWRKQSHRRTSCSRTLS